MSVFQPFQGILLWQFVLAIQRGAQSFTFQTLPRNVRPCECKLPTGIDLCVNSKCTTVLSDVTVDTTACLCEQGYIPNPESVLECIDLDECTYFPDICRAGVSGKCINEMGDYRCECDSRYYITAGREHYCEKRSFFNTPLGFLWFTYYGGGMSHMMDN